MGSGIGMTIGEEYRAAGYLRGTGTDTIVYGYTVKSEDRDSDGATVRGGGYYADGSTYGVPWNVYAKGTDVPPYAEFARLHNQQGHKVDGSRKPFGTNTEIISSPASGDTYRYGETIEFALTFNVELEVEGGLHLSLRVGREDSAGWRGANYRSGSGTDTLVFGYTVRLADEDRSGVTLLGTWIEDGAVKRHRRRRNDQDQGHRHRGNPHVRRPAEPGGAQGERIPLRHEGGYGVLLQRAGAPTGPGRASRSTSPSTCLSSWRGSRIGVTLRFISPGRRRQICPGDLQERQRQRHSEIRLRGARRRR